MTLLKHLPWICALLLSFSAHGQALHIGVLLNDLDAPFFAKVLEGVHQSADLQGVPSERMTQERSQIVSTAVQDPRLMGFRSVEALTRLNAGETVPKYNLIETRLITLETLQSYSGW